MRRVRNAALLRNVLYITSLKVSSASLKKKLIKTHG